jgi:hypothetical protein
VSDVFSDLLVFCRFRKPRSEATFVLIRVIPSNLSYFDTALPTGIRDAPDYVVCVSKHSLLAAVFVLAES